MVNKSKIRLGRHLLRNLTDRSNPLLCSSITFFPGTMTITFCAVLTATFYAKFADHLLHNLVTLIAFASTHFAERMSTCHTYPLLHVSTELESVRYPTTANSGACSPENASGNGKIRLGPKNFFLGRRLPKLLSKVMLVQNVLERHRSKKQKQFLRSVCMSNQ